MNLVEKTKLKFHPMFKFVKPIVRDGVEYAFAVLPGDLYTAAHEDIPNTISENRGWTDVGWLNDAVKNVTPSELDLVFIPIQNISADDKELLQRRARIMEICRLWFTEKLHAFINHEPMLLQILKDKRYRQYK